MNPPDVFDWVHITERSCDGVVKWIKDDGSYVISTKEYGDLWVDLVELEPVESNEDDIGIRQVKGLKGVEVLPVKHCARCGQDHDAIIYRHFNENPIVDDDGAIWDWWGICPNTGDPILMFIGTKDKGELPHHKEANNHES